MTGAVGNDIQTGGTGADHFVFTAAISGLDTITDFASGVDVLEFAGLLTGTFAYIEGAAFTGGGNSQARVMGSQVQLDLDGNGSLDLSINLTGLTGPADLTVLDFLFS